LRCNTLEETEQTLVLDNKLHDFDEALEGLAVADWWRLGLEANFGYDQRLRCDGCDGFGNGSQDCSEVRN
jgi:hypothetical protein